MKIALSLILVIMLALAGFSLVQFEKLDSQTLKLQRSVTGMEASMGQLDSNAQKNQRNLTELQERCQSLKLGDNWQLSEVRHLLRLASIELQVSRDISTSLGLLEAADEQLSRIQDPNLLPVREIIAREKEALQQVRLPDTEKLWLQVGVLIQQIPTLPTRGFRRTAGSESNSKEASKEAAKNPTPWQQNLQATWGELKGLIKIQEHGKPIEPILKDSEQALAQENLLLILEQVRWAVLHRNNTVYQDSIAQAKQYLSRYFEAQDAQSQHFQNSLNEWATVDLRPVLPDIGQALQALQTKG